MIKREIKKYNLVELRRELNSVRSKLLTLRFQIATGNSSEFGKVKDFKKQVAQILTLINQRKLQATKG